jgi:hypothetical protein
MLPDQSPEPIGTLPGIASLNSVYAYECGDEQDHKTLKGEPLDNVMGWDNGWTWDEAVTGYQDEEAAAIEEADLHG